MRWIVIQKVNHVKNNYYQLIKCAIRSENPEFLAFGLRLLAKELFLSGNCEMAQVVLKVALEIYPLKHPYRKFVLEELTQYSH